MGLRLRAPALVLGVLCLAQAGWAGSVRGRVELRIEGTQLSEVGPVLAFLEPVDGRPTPRPTGRPTIRQLRASFSPGFLAVAAGQRVVMPNDDSIFHNVFSYSKPNDFDLGLYPPGESRVVTFGAPGVVKMYCSIHESMNATVYVAPTSHFVEVGADGRFTLSGVPPGRYRLRTWCERLPDTSRTIEVGEGAGREISISIGEPLAGPAAPAADEPPVPAGS